MGRAPPQAFCYQGKKKVVQIIGPRFYWAFNVEEVQITLQCLKLTCWSWWRSCQQGLRLLFKREDWIKHPKTSMLCSYSVHPSCHLLCASADSCNVEVSKTKKKKNFCSISFSRWKKQYIKREKKGLMFTSFPCSELQQIDSPWIWYI